MSVIVINPYYASPAAALPDYNSLSNLELYVDYTGLAVGTTNDYGTVDGSGNVTTLKSLAPSTLGRDFTSVGTAPTLTADGIVFGGAGTLRAGVASKTWANFLHYNATLANLKWTIHAVVKFGTTANPDAVYGLIGNNAGSSANKGFSAFFDDRASQSRNNGLGTNIFAGGGVNILTGYQSDIVTPNQLCVETIETRFDTSINAFRQSIYINGKLQGVGMTSASTSVVTTPTYDLEIGGFGNAVGQLVGIVKELVIQSTVDSGAVRSAFITALMNKHGITAQTSTPTVDTTRTFQAIDTQNDAGKYYLAAALDINPTKPYTISQFFVYGDDHVPDGAKVIKFRKSLDYGITWSVLSTIYDPVGDLNPGDLGGGYSDNGRLHLFTDTRTINATPFFLTYMYSDDDGSNWTTVDLTDVVPVDGLNVSVMYGNLIENDGVLMYPFYKATDSGDATESANYLLRSTDGGANWSVITVRAKGSTYINEASIIGLDNDHILYIARNDATGEWNQYISNDNGLTWTDQGALTFGETLTSAGPCRLTKFKIVDTDVIACWHPDRVGETMKVTYGIAANIISSGVSGWNTSTKTTVINTSRRVHYGGYCHPMNNFNALIASAYEEATAINTDNDFITASMLSTHYSTVKTALGL